MTETPACWTITKDGGSHNRTLCEGHGFEGLLDLLDLEFLLEIELRVPSDS